MEHIALTIKNLVRIGLGMLAICWISLEILIEMNKN